MRNIVYTARCNIVGHKPTSFVRSTTLFAEGNHVLCPLKRNDVASELANNVVSEKELGKNPILFITFSLFTCKAYHF